VVHFNHNEGKLIPEDRIRTWILFYELHKGTVDEVYFSAWWFVTKYQAFSLQGFFKKGKAFTYY
jgi:hypothetical protein